MQGVKIHRHWKYAYVASQRLNVLYWNTSDSLWQSGHDSRSLFEFAASCFTLVEITTIFAASSGFLCTYSVPLTLGIRELGFNNHM